MPATKNKKQELVYGTRVSPFTGDYEIKKGRIVIYQDEFRELDKDLPIESINCRIFAPEDILKILEKELNLICDPDWTTDCLLIPQKETKEVIEMIQKVIPNIDFINSDDDQVFHQRLETNDE